MKTLFIRYKKSKNILEGGEQVSQKNYNVLSHLVGEDNVTVYYIHDESKKRSIMDYVRGIFFFFQNYYFGLTPKRVNDIAALAKNNDVVYIDRSVFGIIAKKLKQLKYEGKVICFFHNIEKLYFEAKIPKYAPWRWLVCHCADKNDEFCCQYGDKVIALNARDNQELNNRYHRSADVLVPVAFKDNYFNNPVPKEMTRPKPKCLFLGAYFKPNNEGIEWFVRNVLPKVNVQLQIVGKGMSKLRETGFITDEIEVISDAPDLRSYFEDADIMILPIFSGSGMKVKTCESLMYGKNILATDEALVGYDVDADKMGGRCNTAEEFIEKINGFIAKPRPRFNTYSRQYFLEHHSEEAVVDKFKQVLGL